MNFKTYLLILIVLICLTGHVQCASDTNDKSLKKHHEPRTLLQGQPIEYGAVNKDLLPDPDYRIKFPLHFPLVDFDKEMILELPDSRLPGAPRTYRGANARHKGIDLYTGECGLLVLSPAEGWIIDLTDKEQFQNSETRDAILAVANKAGFTPSPILENLHGASLVIYHGWDEGTCYYSRLSHLENFSKEWKLGDYIERGETIGYVGASGTSANFKSAEDKKYGCHLHFEWHVIKGGEDLALGFEERDNDLKRRLYYELFTSDE